MLWVHLLLARHQDSVANTFHSTETWQIDTPNAYQKDLMQECLAVVHVVRLSNFRTACQSDQTHPGAQPHCSPVRRSIQGGFQSNRALQSIHSNLPPSPSLLWCKSIDTRQLRRAKITVFVKSFKLFTKVPLSAHVQRMRIVSHFFSKKRCKAQSKYWSFPNDYLLTLSIFSAVT